VAKAKAKALIPLADAAIDTRVAKHKLTVTCGATLKTFLANLAQVVPTSPGT
jgi:hypothetical protein